MKLQLIFSSIALVALTACGGGGGSSSTPAVTYSPVGTFTGSIVNPQGAQGAMALRVDSTGSGEFAVEYPGQSGVDLAFPSSIGHIDGSSFAITDAQFIVGGVATGCPFSLHGTMSSPNELDGTYALGDNSGNCGAPTTINFRIVRAATTPQAFARQRSIKTLF